MFETHNSNYSVYCTLQRAHGTVPHKQVEYRGQTLKRDFQSSVFTQHVLSALDSRLSTGFCVLLLVLLLAVLPQRLALGVDSANK